MLAASLNLLVAGTLALAAPGALLARFSPLRTPTTLHN
jgi:hypothetical protein